MKYIIPNIISLVTFSFLLIKGMPSNWYQWTLVILIIGNVLGLRLRIRKKIYPKEFKNTFF